jgi:hypothetical protein
MNVHELAQAAAGEIMNDPILTMGCETGLYTERLAAIIEKYFGKEQRFDFVVAEKNFSDMPKLENVAAGLTLEEVQAYITWLEKHFADLEAAKGRVQREVDDYEALLAPKVNVQWPEKYWMGQYELLQDIKRAIAGLGGENE